MKLTPRETEVLILIGTEYTNKEIALKLGISPKTVDCHVANLYEKTGKNRRVGLALYAVRTGLVELHDYNHRGRS